MIFISVSSYFPNLFVLENPIFLEILNLLSDNTTLRPKMWEIIMNAIINTYGFIFVIVIRVCIQCEVGSPQVVRSNWRLSQKKHRWKPLHSSCKHDVFICNSSLIISTYNQFYSKWAWKVFCNPTSKFRSISWNLGEAKMID